MSFNFKKNINEAVEDLKQGKIIIVVDDEKRENEGDFVILAEKVSQDAINFMAKYGRGIICLSITEARARELELGHMVHENTSLHTTAFTVSIDALEGTTTGVSAKDRALTIQKAIDPHTRPEDLARPGHVFPLIAHNGGVLRRAGHTEAVIDLAHLAGSTPAGVLCEVMDDDGTMARMPKLEQLASEFNLKLITVADLIEYRKHTEQIVRKDSEVNLPTKFGSFKLSLYKNVLDQSDHHLAMMKGDITTDEPVLVRIHSECLTGDTFGSLRCDCGDQLDFAMRKIQEEGRGVLLYMRQEGRGIGLPNKLLAYELQEKGRDTVQANVELGFDPDLRDYSIGAQILQDLGIKKIRLLTNNPKKMMGLQGYNIEIVERVPIEITPNESNIHYLRTKKEKMGHLLEKDMK